MLLFFMLFNNENAAAQFSKKVHSIDQVEITANRRKVYTDDFKQYTIDSALKKQPHNDLTELLAITSPVFLNTNGSAGSLATPSLRGTTANHTLVNWNGFPINSITLGQSDLSLSNTYFMDEISIIPSAPGTLYGSGTFGGAINLNNQATWNKTPSISASTEYGSWNHQRYSLSGQAGHDQLQVQAKGYYHNATNDYSYLNDQKRNPTWEKRNQNEVSDYGVMQNLFWNPSTRNKFQAGIWYQVKNKSLPPVMGSQATEEQQNDSIFRAYAKWNHVFDQSSLQIKTGYFSHAQLYSKKEQASDDSFLVYSPIHTKKWMNDANFRVYHSDQLIFDLATQYSLLSAEVNTYENDIQNSHRLSFIGALKYKWNRLHANFSIRQQFNNQTDPKTQFSIGGNYHLLNDKLFIRGNFSTKFRLPTFNERYWPELGDPDIQPEQGYSGEAGISFIHKDQSLLKKITAELTGFYLKINNYIEWVPVNSVYYAQNINQIFSRGLEFATQTTVELKPVTIHWSGNYNLTRSTNQGSEDESVNGKQLRYTPLHSLKQFLQFRYKQYALSGSMNYTGIRYVTKDHAGFSLPAHTVFNLYASRSFQLKSFSGSLQLKVKNLMDTQYQVIRGYPMPGRGYYIKLNLTINQ